MSQGTVTPGHEGADKAFLSVPKELKPKHWLLLLGLLILLIAANLSAALPPVAPNSIAGYWEHVVLVFFSEAGAALIIAYVISALFDVQAKRNDLLLRERQLREDKRWQEEFTAVTEARRLEAAQESERRRRELAEDVVFGIFGLRHSPRYVRTVVESALQPSIVRKNIDIQFKITRVDSEVDGGRKFVLLDAFIVFTLQNVSLHSEVADIGYSVSLRNEKNIREKAEVYMIKLGDEDELNQAEIDQGMSVSSDGGHRVYHWNKTLPPQSSYPVMIKSRTVRAESDTHFWGSSVPTIEGMSITVHAPEELEFGISSLTSGKCITIAKPEDGFGVWKIDGSILPNESVALWWRVP